MAQVQGKDLLARLASDGDGMSSKENLPSFELREELSEFFDDVVGKWHWFSWSFKGDWLI